MASLSRDLHHGLHQPTINEIQAYFRGADPIHYEETLKLKSAKLQLAEEDVSKLVQSILKTFNAGISKRTLKESECAFPIVTEVKWVAMELNEVLKGKGQMVDFSEVFFVVVGRIEAGNSELVSELRLISTIPSAPSSTPVAS